jgi:ribosomal protein S6
MDTVQRTYELTYLLPGNLTDNEVAQARTEIEQLLKKYKAEVTKNEDWGRKQLAYTITHESKKQTEGIYTHMGISLVPSKAPELDHEMFLQNKVMRHLLLVTDGEEEVSETK